MNVHHDNSASAFASTASDLIGSNLRAGTTVLFTISTRSMVPTLLPGDRVMARGIRADELRIGDIVMIRSESHWLAHRFIERRVVNGESRFVTQGDNSPEPDSLWSREQICGIILAVRREETQQNLESKRARWFGALIARFLRWRSEIRSYRSDTRKTIAMKINAASVRGIVWLAYPWLK